STRNGGKLAEFLLDHDLGQLPFARLWALETMNAVPGIVGPEVIMRIAESSHPSITVRCTAEAARSQKQVDWVRERKENWSNFAPWDRRAIILSGGALPNDERNPWLEVVEESGDLLDKAVAQYVRGTS
ncbi:MAG: hypothetical protein WBX00_36510, partial [Isosphaeraceae bacterium]